MTDTSEAKRHVIEEAERVNQERMAAVEELADAVARRVNLEHELAEAKKEEKRLMTAAEKQGWTRTQINRFAKPPKAAGRKTMSTSNDQTRREEQESFSPDAQN